ncbi:exosortase-dependent surface protein XDP2 [Cylindrospermum sp. FACHB-282]|uniref:exosortase-dependent surface protein XDP2 n=1 Tax=Cylindrospermum sp. FACHB-282 TaxID=2692794 RepID=UPI0016896D2D|nr:exosortase-dependent surface protein XDP2 [Cylindrospermum sp. FACHB-282]MBD2384864.1 PEP-CTERM sorting domain-containing protein [Cylindrospermum sp. FACHB-282]
MKAQGAFISIGLVCTAVLAMANSAQAASFTSNVSYTSAKNDVILNSITQSGKTINSFSYVNNAVIQYNTPRNATSTNSGAASTDKGDNATSPLAPAEDPTSTAVAKFLGNNNLNNIIDTEDDGTFTIDVFFDSEITQDNLGLDNLFFWERGVNSDLGIQALDSTGSLIAGSYKKLLRTEQQYTGFKIDTVEIASAQGLGSWGVSLNELGVTKLSGLRLTANASFNGPDFKVIARKTTPEPTTILGLGGVAALALLRRRKLKSA